MTRSQLLSEPESSACSSYARYILDVGVQGDILELYVAIASCLIGYGEVGLWLQKQVEGGKAKMEGNLYKRWMEDYAGEDFLGAVNRGIGECLFDSSLIAILSPTRDFVLPTLWIPNPTTEELTGRKPRKESSGRTTLA